MTTFQFLVLKIRTTHLLQINKTHILIRIKEEYSLAKLEVFKGSELELTSELVIPISAHRVYSFETGTRIVLLEIDDKLNEYLIEVVHSKTKLKLPQFMLDNRVVFKNTKNKGKRYSKIVETELTFGLAMDYALVLNKKVTRAKWDGYWCKQEIRGTLCKNAPSWKGEFLVAILKDGGYAVATPYQEDMLATDWMVVE